MDDIKRMLIERACERLVTQYCHFIDHGEAARIAELFSEDGVWANATVTRNGRTEIAAGFGRRQDNAARISRHVCCNQLVEVIDDDNATGVVYVTLYRQDGEVGRRTAPADVPDIVGEYRDTFVRTNDGWRFRRRDVVASFVKRREQAGA